MRDFRILFAILLAIIVHFTHASAFEVKEIEPQEFKSTVMINSKIKLIYIFTSWCSVCKRSFSQVIDLYKDFDSKEVDIVLISLDDNDAIVKKTFKPFEDQDFTIYRINQDNPKEILKALLKAGILYQGSIPHATLIDSNGSIVVNGSYQVNSLKRGIEYLVNNK